MLATIKWNSRYNAREWVMMAGALVVQLGALNASRQKVESKPRRPLWKQFDDTHHWDSTAEEWVPNHDRRSCNALCVPQVEFRDFKIPLTDGPVERCGRVQVAGSGCEFVPAFTSALPAAHGIRRVAIHQLSAPSEKTSANTSRPKFGA